MRAEIALLSLVLASPAAAEAPLSAIDWLSDSLRAPPVAPGGAVAEDARPGEVTTTTLEDGTLPLAGLHDGAGLPDGLWDGAGARDIVTALDRLPERLPGRLDDLLVRLLTARAAPPVWGRLDAGDLMVARVDTLLARGHLSAAAALAAEGGDGTEGAAEMFRRRFDIALLTGDENDVCEELKDAPGLSPTWPARVFCLARNGDFDAAALTYGTAESLGMLAPGEDTLLAMFLDPELFADEDLGAPPRRPTPLEYRLWEAVGERQPTAGLPLAFAHADLSDRYGWKTRLEAAERLAAMGALSADRLFALYAENREAASGGLWDRVGAVADLRRALEAGDPDAVAETLPVAWDRMRARGLDRVFAEAFAVDLAGLPLTGEAGTAAVEVALLAPGPFRAPKADGGHDDLIALAGGGAGRDPQVAAALSGSGSGDGDRNGDRHGSGDAPGLTALRAMEDLAAGADGDAARLAKGLAALCAAGFADEARRVAVAVLLGPPAA